MRDRMGVGDTAVNLAAAGLVLNAWILSGEERYRDWIVEYVGAWRERTEANGGLIPDNVGPDGVVGSLLEGRWYGGHYGWSWPHGWHSVGHAACVAALAAATVTGDDDYLSMVATSLDALIGARQGDALHRGGLQPDLQVGGRTRSGRRHAHLAPAVPPQRLAAGSTTTRLMPPVPVALWHHTASDADRARLEGLREADGIDWRTVRPFRAKEESGHEKAWFAFLAGDDPGLPGADPRHRPGPGPPPAAAHRPLPRPGRARGRHPRVAAVQPGGHRGPRPADLGRPAGGLQRRPAAGAAALPRRRRPPRRPAADVAALVTSIDPEATTVELVNLAPETDRTVIVQAGAFAEHTITAVRYTTCRTTAWIGDMYDYGHRAPQVTTETVEVDGPWLRIELPRSSRVQLTLDLGLRAYAPSYRTPFDTAAPGQA